jgi:hypothetical protein
LIWAAPRRRLRCWEQKMERERQEKLKKKLEQEKANADKTKPADADKVRPARLQLQRSSVYYLWHWVTQMCITL